jgi:hypothetical protein
MVPPRKWPARSAAQATPYYKDWRPAMQPDSHEHSINPACAKCGSPRMWLMRTEEQYPGYISRMFECPVCGETMTQWASDSTNQEPPAN